ncbi:MAG TPA: DUF5684 domain-containing protein [Patescibacteria group bacterium]|nr:DUF5684 domain-containing protein [Patescibacteria group bacterium]
MNPFLQSDFQSNLNKLNDVGAYNNFQDSSGLTAVAGVFGIMAGAYMVLVILTIIALYVLSALSLYKISKKTNIGTPWFAWVPILNSILMLNIAGLSGWYLFLVLIPMFVPILGWIAGVLMMVYVWMRFAVACKKPDYLGLFAVVPPLSILLLLYFAYSNELKLK